MDHAYLTPDGYLPRIYDDKLSRLLQMFAAVEVAGPMWCGKTWTSLAHGRSVTRVGRYAVRPALEADPTVALRGERPHVIDEWQDVPPIWDAVRDAVDGEPGVAGSYILAGSSTACKEEVSHSGAGRIARMRMRPMTLLETGDSTGAVSLRGLFDGSFENQLVQQGLAPLAAMVCRGGWPALRSAPFERAASYIDSYFDALCDVSMPRRGLDGSEARRVARSLARNLGSAAKLSTIAADAFAVENPGDALERRAAAYIAAFESLYVVEPLTGWDAPVRSKTRIRTKPKRYFADPSLAANMLQMSPERLIADGQLFGLLFESLCLRDLAAYTSVLPEAGPDALHYYRDSDGLEVDFVIELRDGRWGAFEVKLGENKAREGATALNRLRRKVAANPSARNPEPSFMAVLVGAGEFARHDPEEDVYVIPLTSLGV